MSKEVTSNELSTQIETLALAVANGFEDAKNDRELIKGDIKRLDTKADRLEHKVDNWMDRTGDRIVIVERKLGIDPSKQKVATG